MTLQQCLGVNVMDICTSLIITTLSRRSTLLYAMRQTAPLLPSPLNVLHL